MDVLIVTVFISLVLVAAAVLFLFLRAREGDFEHGDRLSLLPLDGDDGLVTQSKGKTPVSKKKNDKDK